MYQSIIRDDEYNIVTLDHMTHHLQNSRWFKITYYHKGQAREVTRYGIWDSKCRAWQTKNKDYFAVFSRWFLFHVNMMSMWLLNEFGYI